MKKSILFYFTCITCLAGQAQWATTGTNIYNTNTGNVGINTSTPGTQLDILTASIADGVQIRYTGAAGFLRLTGNNFAATYLNPITMTGDAGLIFGGTTADAITTGLVIAPYKSTLSGLRVDKNGNVGIYTNDTKGYQLAVNGSAIFTSATVKLYPNWPDYVFKPGYALPSLDSVSAYIRTYRHLPGIPSADSVQERGIDIGSTQAAFLKKIEELTLYTIDQDKSINELKENQRQLQKQNELLSRQLDLLEKKLSGLSPATRQ
jgi:hypothetical protein